MLTLKAIKNNITFFHSLGNPKDSTLDYCFYASHIRHDFPYIPMTYLKYFEVIVENSTSAFNYWDDFSWS